MDLRQFFIVDELERVALLNDEKGLAIVREIIRRIKRSQLAKMQIADNQMILKVLEEYKLDIENELEIVSDYLAAHGRKQN